MIQDPEGLPEEALDSGRYGMPTYVGLVYGWNVQYWPGAPTWASILSASPGRQLYYGDQPIFEEEDVFMGTSTAQAVEVTLCMMLLVKEQGWQGVHIVSGSAVMMRTAWMMADALKLPCAGYTPQAHDASWVKRMLPLIEPCLSFELDYVISDVYLAEEAMQNTPLSEFMPTGVLAESKDAQAQLDAASEFGSPQATDQASADTAQITQDDVPEGEGN